jgi:flagellar assembly protein FliH
MNALIRGTAMGRNVRRLQRPGEAAPPVAPPAHATPVAPQVQPPTREPLEEALARLEAERAEWQEQARQELAALRLQAEEEGRAAGHAQGMGEAAASAQRKLHQLDTLIEQLGLSLASGLDGLEDLAVAITFEAVVKILGNAMATPEGVRALVREAVARAKRQEKIAVRLSPDDFRLLMQESLDPHWLARPGVELQPDEQVGVGGCLVHTDSGLLDAGLETQLRALRQVLLQARQHAAAAGAV